MTPAELLQGTATDFFTHAERNAVITASNIKNGKRYLICLVCKQEEIVRQLWLQRLTPHYGYPVARLAVEHPITFGRQPNQIIASFSPESYTYLNSMSFLVQAIFF